MSAMHLRRFTLAALIGVLTLGLSSPALQAQTAGPTLQVTRVDSANAPDYTCTSRWSAKKGELSAG